MWLLLLLVLLLGVVVVVMVLFVVMRMVGRGALTIRTAVATAAGRCRLGELTDGNGGTAVGAMMCRRGLQLDGAAGRRKR